MSIKGKPSTLAIELLHSCTKPLICSANDLSSKYGNLVLDKDKIINTCRNERQNYCVKWYIIYQHSVKEINQGIFMHNDTNSLCAKYYLRMPPCQWRRLFWVRRHSLLSLVLPTTNTTITITITTTSTATTLPLLLLLLPLLLLLLLPLLLCQWNQVVVAVTVVVVRTRKNWLFVPRSTLIAWYQKDDKPLPRNYRHRN